MFGKKFFLFFMILSFSFAGEAFMSGSFTAYYGERDFLLYYDDGISKIFRDPEQADSYYREEQKEFYSSLSRRLPALLDLIKKAKNRRMPVLDMDPCLPEIAIQTSEELPHYQKDSFPLIMAVPSGRYIFKLALSQTLTRDDFQWLKSNIDRILGKEPDQEEERGLIDPSHLQSPNVIKMFGDFGLYAGTRFCSTPASAPFFRQILQKTLDRISPALEKEIEDKSFRKKAGFAPLDLNTKLSASLEPGRFSLLFNPNGSAVDEKKGISYIRPAWYGPAMNVITLFLVKKYDWGKASGHVSCILERLMNNKNHTNSRRDALFAVLKNKAPGRSRKESALYELAALRTARVQEALSGVAADKQEDRELRYTAVYHLAEIADRNSPERIVGDMAQVLDDASLDENTQLYAVKAVGKTGRAKAVKVCISILKKEKGSYHLRYEASEALKALGKSSVPPLIKLADDRDWRKDKEKYRNVLALLCTIQARNRNDKGLNKELDRFFSKVNSVPDLAGSLEEARNSLAEPLYNASGEGNLEQVKKLIQEGADVDGQIKDGFSPLMYACQEGRIEVVRELLRQGARIDLKNRYGDTAVNYAGKNKKVLELLQQAGK